MHKFLAGALIASLPLVAVAADDFPSKPISLIVPNPPGGLVDTSARVVSEPLARVIGKTVVVENKDGGSGNIAYQAVARSKPDGYTLLISYSAYHVGNPAITAKLPWDPIKDFEPVALLTVATNVVAVNNTVPANNLQELVAFFKKSPGKYNYASQGIGSMSHIGTEIFKQQTGTEITHIAYRGSGPAIQDVLAGNVQLFITTPPSVMGHVQTGKLKALAVTSSTRHPMLPNVPTSAEAGLPAFTLESWVGLFAPAGTPKPVIAKLAASVQKALAMPESVKRAEGAGIEVKFEGPEVLAQRVRTDLAYWAKTVKAAGITPE